MAKSRKNTPKPLILDDAVSNDVLFPAGFGHGYDPLQKAAHPVEFRALPSTMKLIPRSEWSARIRERKQLKAGLRDVRRRAGPNGGHIPALDQNGQGYCWAYSVSGTVMMANVAAGKEYVRPSAHAVACMVKGFKDEGGWCGLSAKFIRDRGVPSVVTWPEKSMSRAHDNAATWAEAARYKVVEDWVDVMKPAYDQNLTYDQLITCLLLNRPCAGDFNWWGHSVLLFDADEVDGEVCPVGLNSWTDQWGDLGEFTLQGQKRIPDGALATVTVGD